MLTAILEEKPYPVRVLGVFGSNPMLTWSNSRRVYEALKAVDFLVVADLVMTPTAALADIVLPAASYLETDARGRSRGSPGLPCLEAQQKVVQIGECRSDLEILRSWPPAGARGPLRRGPARACSTSTSSRWA